MTDKIPLLTDHHPQFTQTTEDLYHLEIDLAAHTLRQVDRLSEVIRKDGLVGYEVFFGSDINTNVDQPLPDYPSKHFFGLSKVWVRTFGLSKPGL